MDEKENNDTFLLDKNNNNNNNNISNKNLYNPIYSPPKVKTPNYIWLKYHYNFIISLIITILFMLGFLITIKGICDIKSGDNHLMKTFNITNFYITNETCPIKNNIFIESKKYYKNINNFVYSRNLAIFIGKFGMLFSLMLISIIFYIKFKEEKKQKATNVSLISSFFICLILFIIELFLFNIFLYSFLRLFDIIHFLESNIKRNCILFFHWDYNEKVLKHLMKMIMVIELLKICNLQVLVYFLKQLIILNNFFYAENFLPTRISREQNIQSNIIRY